MKEFLILSEKNIVDYLHQHVVPYLGFKIEKIISAKEFDRYSNANFIFKIRVHAAGGKKHLFLRQAQSYVKKSLKRGKKIFIQPNRVFGEVKMLNFLKKLWGQEYVPEVLHFDQKNYSFLMTDVSRGKKILIEEFAKNQVHPELGGLFGRLFGQLHGSTFGRKRELISDQQWKKQIIHNLIDESWSSGLKKFFPEEKVNDFVNAARQQKPSVVWLDPIYRNIFVKKDSISMVDFDFSCIYDPAFDNGIFLSHWIWMMLKGDKNLAVDSQRFINDYIINYRTTFEKHSKSQAGDLDNILDRTVGWAGFYLVSRTDGKSGSYFKDNPAWEKRIRKTGINLFAKNKKDSFYIKIKRLILE